ncbi:MAG: hypothetical protein ABII06_08320 [Pseudomonadota bacterium]
MGHIFLGKIKIGLDTYYQMTPYERTTGLDPSGNIVLRDDDTFYLSGTAGYIITDWLTFSFQGGFEERDSNVAGNNYDNRFFMVKIESQYNLGSR